MKHLNHIVAGLITLLVVLFAGCAPTNFDKLNRVSIGMTKQEVIRVAGNPDSISANKERVFLIYHLREELRLVAPRVPYFVLLEGGQVTEYGKVGDFSSTKIPEAILNIK